MLSIIAFVLAFVFKQKGTFRLFWMHMCMNISMVILANEYQPQLILKCKLSVTMPTWMQILFLGWHYDKKIPVYIVIASPIFNVLYLAQAILLKLEMISVGIAENIRIILYCVSAVAVLCCFIDDYLYRKKDPGGYFCTPQLWRYHVSNKHSQKFFRW